MYFIIGGDGKEYGPVTAAQLQQWVRESRLHGQTQARAEGATQWQALSAMPEMAALFSGPPTLGAGPAAGPGMPAGPGSVHEGDYELDILGCVTRSFDTFKGNMGPLIVATLIGLSPWIVGGITRIFGLIPLIGMLFSLLGFLISMATLVIGGPLMGGLYSVFLKASRGQPFRPQDVFAGFKSSFLHLFLGYLIPGLFIGACLVPVLVVLFITVFAVIFQNQQHGPPPFSTFVPAIITLAIMLPVIVWLSTNWMFTLALVIDRKLDFWTAMKTSWRQVMRHWFTVCGLAVVCALINLAGLVMCGIGVLFTAPVVFGAMMQAYEIIFLPRTAHSSQGA
jgi:hypothetical protein